MKLKFLLCIVAILALNHASRVLGSMVVIMVDAANIQTMPFIVRTDRSGNAAEDKSINFYVIADPKGHPYQSDDHMHWQLGGARLTIYDGTNFVLSNTVSSCSIAGEKVPSFMQDVKSPLAKKGVFYSFEASTNHLASADFEICYGSHLHPAVNCYRFALQPFVPETSIGLLLGLKNGKIEITGVLPNTPASRAGLSPGLIVQKIDGVDSGSYGLKMAQDNFRSGIVGLELIDPSDDKTNEVVLTTAKTFPSVAH